MKNNVVYEVSKRSDGNMAEKWAEKVIVISNRNQFLKKLGIELKNCVMASLELGTRVVEVGNTNKGKYVECDALVTREKGVALWMVVADCYATAVYDPIQKILALAHLGRQGLDRGLVEKVIFRMKALGSNPKDVMAITSPGLKKESYTWKGKLPMKRDWGVFVSIKYRYEWNIDVSGFLTNEFLRAGVREEKIQVSPVDTFTDERYFSHLRSVKTGEPEGRFATVGMMK